MIVQVTASLYIGDAAALDLVADKGVDHVVVRSAWVTAPSCCSTCKRSGCCHTSLHSSSCQLPSLLLTSVCAVSFD